MKVLHFPYDRRSHIRETINSRSGFYEAGLQCVNFSSTHVLLFAYRDKWSGDIALPGGRQELDETELQAAVRECQEEVGVSLDSR